MEDYKNNYPIAVILDSFDIKRSTYYRWKKEPQKPQKGDKIIEAIEQIRMENHSIYGYRTITRLLKKSTD